MEKKLQTPVVAPASQTPVVAPAPQKSSQSASLCGLADHYDVAFGSLDEILGARDAKHYHLTKPEVVLPGATIKPQHPTCG